MAVLTINQKLDQVNNFINSIKDSKNSYYFFVGKAEPWRDENGNVDETQVPVADNSLSQIEQSVYKDIVYGKLLDSSDVTSIVRRYNWTNNTIYARYNNNDPDIYSKNFYVINDSNEVYKCIDNGRSPNYPDGVPSSVKPSITQTSGTFRTYDGYIWKYMYTCDPTQYNKFQTKDYIPVTPNNDVITYSVNGTIDSITLMNGGENYQVFETGFLSKFINSQVVELAYTASPHDNHYKDSQIYLKAGFGGGQIRRITSSSGLNKTISVEPAFNYYENLKLKNINGIFTIGDLVEQHIYNIKYIFDVGFLNIGDTVIQSDTGSSGIIITSNTSVMRIETNSEVEFNVDYPIIDTASSPVQKNGLVDVYDDSNLQLEFKGRLTYEAIANSGWSKAIPFSQEFTGFKTKFEDDFSVGSFLQVNNEEYKNVRRITRIADPNWFVRTAVANTQGIDVDNNVIKMVDANTYFRINDYIQYIVPTNNTAIKATYTDTSGTPRTSLANNSFFYISFVNTSSIAISTTYNGANIDLTEDRTTFGEKHSFKYTVVNRNVSANTIGANAGVLVDTVNGTNHIYSVSSADVFLMPRANTFFSVHDKVYYTVANNSIPLGSLTGNSFYYISFVNSTSFALSANDSLQSGLSANISLEDRRLRVVKPVGGHNDVHGNPLAEPNEITYLAYDIKPDTTALGVNSTSDTIYLAYANSYYEKNYKVKYTTKNNGSPIGGLVNNSIYYISFSNSSSFALSTDYNGSNIQLTESRGSACTDIHNIQFVQDQHTFTVFPYMFVNSPFVQGLDNKKIYSVPTALSIDSYNTSSSLGSIVYVNLNSAEITFADIHPVDQSFLFGESLVVVDNANNNLYTNGTVSFTNNFTVILSDVQGSNFIPVKESYRPSYLYGLTSKIKARIVSLNTDPNITVETQEGGFSSGGTIFVKTADGVPTANAKIISKYSSPNDITEYVIGPRVNIDGDGNGALAFCTVDLSSNNPTRKITAIELINHGQNYTRANVSVTSNTLYGHGASFEATVSPIRGHGFDAYSELGSFYTGISKKFDTAINESFYFPTYGSYRKIGIIRNPFINDVIFDVDNFDRVTLKYDNWNSIYFEDDEILVQPGSNSAGIIVSSNSTAIELKNVRGTFLQDPDNLANASTTIHGWVSGANAHVTNNQIKYFTLASDLESVSEEIPGGTGKINQVFLDTGEVVVYRNVIANTYSSQNPVGVDSARIVDAALVDSINDVIPLENANIYFSVNDKVYYYTPAVSDGAIGGLSNNTFYYISFANSSTFALSETYGGANIALSVTYSADAEYHKVRYVDSGKITGDNNYDVIKIDLANTIYKVGDVVTYLVPEDGDAIGGLLHNNDYYIAYVNSSSFALSNEPEGDVIPITESRITTPSTFTIYANTDGVEASTNTIFLENISAKLAVNDKIYYSYPETNTAINGLLNYTYYYVSYVQPSVSHPIVANTSFVNSIDNTIKLSGASTKLHVGDKLFYKSEPGIPISPLVDGTYYYVSSVSGDWFSLAETRGGSTINISESRTDDPGEIHHVSTLSKFALSATKNGSNLQISATKEVSGSLVDRTDNPGEEHSIFITPQVHQFKYNVTNLNAKNTKIRVTDAVGSFAVGDHIYEPRTNAHAQITKILTANGEKDSSIGFGNKFNQTARITLSANDHPYIKYEYVYQSDTYATGQIISTNDELDIEYIDEANFVVGEKVVNQQTHATAIISSVNTASKMIKLTSVSTEGFDDYTNKPFNPSNIIKNSTETKTTAINKVYSVLVLADVDHVNNNETTPYLGKFRIGNNNIWGYTSNSKGETVLSDSIVYPDLVKYSGKVIYTDNISKFDKDPSSNEQLKLIIKF
jgi:hypothetical protein